MKIDKRDYQKAASPVEFYSQFQFVKTPEPENQIPIKDDPMPKAMDTYVYIYYKIDAYL